MQQLIVLLAILLFSYSTFCQYAPKVGEMGTSAIHKDDILFVSWASQCQIARGWQNISDTTLGVTSVGDATSPIGKAGENGVVSLGDGGYAICTFPSPIKNEAGYDFTVFENSFDDEFLELAFVEVSSDGNNFFRFLAHSLTDTTLQTESFGITDATKINNLAGKYRGNYGTPFDLEELDGVAGLDIQNITYIKIVDVVGSIDNRYATRDTAGNKINDPFPTPFPSGGFDLDAIGIIHQQAVSSIAEVAIPSKVFPNPVKRGNKIFIQENEFDKFILLDIAGKKIIEGDVSTIQIPHTIKTGMYFLQLCAAQKKQTVKIILE